MIKSISFRSPKSLTSSKINIPNATVARAPFISSFGLSTIFVWKNVTVFGHFENRNYEAKRFARSRRELVEREMKKRYLKKYHPKPEPRVTVIEPQPVNLPSPKESRPLPLFQQNRDLNDNVVNLSTKSKITEAHEALELLLKKGVSPSINTFASLMQAFIRAKQYEKAIAIFEQAKNHGSGPNLMMFSVLISSLGKNGYTEQMEKYLQQFSQFGLVPHVFNYNAVLSAYSKKEDTQSMWKYFKQMEANKSKEAQPDKLTVQIMLAALQKKNDPTLLTFSTTQPTPK